MKVALLGARGMIGSKVTQSILRQGHQVIELFFTKYPVFESELNERYLDLLNVSTIRPDIFEDVDALIHCAGVVDEDFIESAEQGYRKGTYCAKILFEIAQKAGVKFFAYISSAHIYGNLSGRIDEASSPNPLSDYAISHYATEQILQRITTTKSDIQSLVLRPCGTYGLPMSVDSFKRWSLVPFNFPRQACQNQEIALLKNSDLVYRNFISANTIGDHVAAFLNAELPFLQDQQFKAINPLGSYSNSIYDFALLCADNYKKLTGQECPVIMPNDPDESVRAKFPPPLNYQSLYSDFSKIGTAKIGTTGDSAENINDFVLDLIRMLKAEN